MGLAVVAKPFQSALVRLVTGSICISFSPVFIKLAQVGPDSAGFYRMSFAAVSLFALLCVRGDSLRLPKKALWMLAGAGVFLSLDFMCWNRSIHLIGPGLSTMLGNFQVFFTALFCFVFFRKKPGRLFIISVLMALIGVVLITGLDIQGLSGDYRLGILLALLTAMLYSGYLLFIQQAMTHQEVSGVSGMLMVSLVCAGFLGTVMLGARSSFAIPDQTSLLSLVGVGLLSTTLGWSLISSAIRTIPATIAGLVLLLQPTLAFVWDVWFFSRPTKMVEFAGVGLILLAIYTGSYKSARR